MKFVNTNHCVIVSIILIYRLAMICF